MKKNESNVIEDKETKIWKMIIWHQSEINKLHDELEKIYGIHKIKSMV